MILIQKVNAFLDRNFFEILKQVHHFFPKIKNLRLSDLLLFEKDIIICIQSIK
jgi:hypothetical protein